MRHPNAGSDVQSRLSSYAAAVKSAAKSGDWHARLGRWPVYAAAAGAALASATSAEAGTIVSGFSGESIAITPFTGAGHSYPTAYAVLQTAHRYLGRLRLRLDYVRALSGPVGNQVLALQATAFFEDASGGLVATTGGGLLNLFRTNASIGRTAPHFGSSAPAYRKGNTAVQGQFIRSEEGFAGFRLNDNDYGWIRLEWKGNGSGYPDYLKAFDWAVNTSGAFIQAGEGAAPEPGTLPMALLALGAAGIAALRKRRRTGAAH